IAADAALLQSMGARLAGLLDAPDILQLRQWRHRHSAGMLERFDQLARTQASANLKDVIDELGALEALWSAAVAARELGWTYPQAGAALTIEGLFHPLIEGAVVRNEVVLGGAVRVCFVTGPNMGGKSTFLKAIAIAVLLAQCGCAVPARAMVFAPVDTIFS